jgi:Fe-S cluster assembly iron-binding protein IscA
MLTLTSDAAKAIERILTAPGVPGGAGIRIKGVTPADDPAVTSELQVEVAEQPGEGDEVIEEGRARVFVEGSVCSYLADKLLEAEMVEERIRFSLAGQAASPGSR